MRSQGSNPSNRIVSGTQGNIAQPPGGTAQVMDRPADDQLLLLPEVCELKRTTEATERWLRNQGKAPYLFKSGRRLVAWRSDVLAHLDAERIRDAVTATT